MDHALASLPEWHLRVLRWFSEHTGQFVTERPVDVGIGVPVTDPYGKGIRKPKRELTSYAISVYQSPKSPYADQPPILWGDGQWTYVYHQEGPSDEDPTLRATNRGLLECSEDHLPVGVILPATEKGIDGYRIMGLAFVNGWRNGCFILTGPVRLSTALGLEGGTATVSLVDFPETPFDPDAEMDDRQKTVAEVVRRQGQPQFRRWLLHAYEGKCCISQYDAESALEAAHIIRYRGAHTNHPENGLLLRADLHGLFDLGLLGIRPDTMRVVLSTALRTTRYESLESSRVRLPREKEHRPNEIALQKHLDMFHLLAR